MANGMCIAGFCWQLPTLPVRALPSLRLAGEYRLTTGHDIVAIAAIDTTLVIGTKGYPYLAQG